MINFPNSLDDDTTLYIAVNNLRTRLTSAISDSATTIPVVTTSGFPTTGFISILTGGNIVNTEAIEYTNTTANTFAGATRGAGGTTALAHDINDNVDLTIVAPHHNVLKDAIIELENFVGVSGSENFVVDLNNLQGPVTLAGINGTSIHTAGQVITVSGGDDVNSLNGLQGSVLISGTEGTSIHTFGQGILVSGTLSTAAALTVREVDSSPSVSNVDTIVVSNGTLTDNGGGQVTITTGGGGTALTIKEIDGNPSVSNVDTIRVSNGTLADDGSGQVTITIGAAGSASAAGGFSGALIATSSGSTVPHLTQFNLAWEDEVQDTDDYYDANEPTRLTVPSGLNIDTVVLKAQVDWDASSIDGMRFLELFKNGSALSPDVVSKVANPVASAGQGTTHGLVSYPITASGGDYFELRITQANASAAAIDIASTERNWFSIEDVTSGAVGPEIIAVSGTFSESLTISGAPVATGTSVGGGALKAATLTTSSGITVPNAVVIAVPWDSEIFDEGGWSDLSTHAARLTVPPGVNFVQVSAGLRYDNGTGTGDRGLSINRNGISNDRVCTIQVEAASVDRTALTIISPVLVASGGDYFEVRTSHQNGVSLDLQGNVTDVFFGIQEVK